MAIPRTSSSKSCAGEESLRFSRAATPRSCTPRAKCIAIRSRVPYLDIAPEQAAVLHVFERFSSDARANDIVIAPALAFYGGLGDLLATAALGDWDRADRYGRLVDPFSQEWQIATHKEDVSDDEMKRRIVPIGH
jgi:hypothetical protein